MPLLGRIQKRLGRRLQRTNDLGFDYFFGITFKTVKGTNFHLHTQKEKTQLVGGDRAQGNSFTLPRHASNPIRVG